MLSIYIKSYSEAQREFSYKATMAYLSEGFAFSEIKDTLNMDPSLDNYISFCSKLCSSYCIVESDVLI